LIPEGLESPPPPFADPVPQALILTAIVIGFGLQAFALVLIKRVYQAVGTDDLDQMKATDD
jgi:multicomponent Na+:H+ antiporter subunit C